MDFSEIFGFLIILKETLKILPKNGRIMASIAVLSLILPSILFLLFVYFFQSLMANMTAASYNPNNDDDDPHVFIKYMALVLAVEFTFLIIYLIISHLSNIATILVSSFSYTDKNLTSKDLFSSIKITWKRPFSKRIFLLSGYSSSRYLPLAVVLAVLFVVMYPNFITICIAVIFGVIVFIFQLYSSVIWALSVVVCVVEDCSRVEAVEKAEKLVKGGNHLHGFMLNLFFNLVALILLLPVFYYYYIGEWSANIGVIYCWLFFLNLMSLLKMLVFMAYTVLYFRCRKHHGEEIVDIIGVGDVHYTKLPALGSDIP